jgi:serine/threonine protein kinase/tetratricopeptide (TPR) repeat protein
MSDMHDAVRTPPAAPQDLTGTTVGRFNILARLGAGGMGEVYRAEDTKLRRIVAIKRMAPRHNADPQETARLLREGQRASALHHPNVASVFDVLEEKGEIFLVMEYVEGETLRHRLLKPFTPDQFLNIATQSAEALAAAHDKSILHGDIKPENIMLTQADQVKLLDFGVARRLTSSNDNTLTGTLNALSAYAPISGTPTYMPPEVLMGNLPDLRADVFALGVVFYEMLGGRHPFQGPTMTATAAQILHREPAPLDQLGREVPDPLVRVVAKALSKEPEKRYQNARELLGDLNAVRQGAKPSAPKVPGRMSPFRRSLPYGAAALVLASLFALRPVRAALSGIFGHAASKQQSGQAPGQPVVNNLAVLPASVQGDDPKLHAFADGLVESVTGKLARLSENHPLGVITTSQIQDKKITTPEQASQEFGANLGLRLTVQSSGDLLRVNYSLVDSKSGRALAGDSVTAPAADSFALEDKVSEGVARALQIELRPEERNALATHGTVQAAAYDYYLQGRGYLQAAFKPENVTSALTMFDQGLKLDPNYGLALAGRGQAYWRRYEESKDKKWIALATADCTKAVQLGNAGADGHICLGVLANGAGKYPEAATEFKRAIELEPANDDAYVRLARVYTQQNKLADAEKTFQRAISLRPQYHRGYEWLGIFYLQQAQYEKAVPMFLKEAELAPDSFRAYSNLGAAYLYLGRDADAITMFERSIQTRPSPGAYSNLGTAYFRVRRFGDAAKSYKEAIKSDESDYDLWSNIGDSYYFGGQRDEAKKAYRKGLGLALPQLQVNPNDARLCAGIAAMYAMVGDRDNALKYLDRSLELRYADKELLFNAAVVYNVLGETGVALEWLRKSLAAGYSPSVVRAAPIFDNLRDNPSFQQLVQQESRPN